MDDEKDEVEDEEDENALYNEIQEDVASGDSSSIELERVECVEFENGDEYVTTAGSDNKNEEIQFADNLTTEPSTSAYRSSIADDQSDEDDSSDEEVDDGSNVENNSSDEVVAEVFDKNQVYEIVSIKSHKSFPEQIVVPNSKTGEMMPEYQDTYECVYRQGLEEKVGEFVHEELLVSCQRILYEYCREKKINVYNDVNEYMEQKFRKKECWIDKKGRLKEKAGGVFCAMGENGIDRNDIPRREGNITTPKQLEWDDQLHTSGEEECATDESGIHSDNEPDILKRKGKRRTKYATHFVKEFRSKKTAEKQLDFVHDEVRKLENVMFVNQKYFVNEKMKIGLYVKRLQTGGGYKKKVKPVKGSSKMRKHPIIDKKDTVVTENQARLLAIEFFRGYPNHTLMIMCGTYLHQQLLFLQRKLGKSQNSNKYFAKVYDSRVHGYKIIWPIQKFFNLIKLSSDQYKNLMYDASTHRLYNNKRDCSCFVSLEARNCMKFGRTPFNRAAMKFQEVLKINKKKVRSS